MEDATRWDELALRASQVFRPGAPINEKDLFSGRKNQIRQVIDAVNQAGQHAIIFGERGVGKTSLSRVMSQFLSGYSDVLVVVANCEGTDTFETVWTKAFNRIDVAKPGFGTIGFSNPDRQRDVFKMADTLVGPVTSDVVRDQLELLAQRALPIVIIDEFDRLKPDIAKAFADAIKNLSDHDVRATVVLVGVGDSVDQLIEDHRSVGRALKQVQMPRMAASEISSVVKRGLQSLGMTITDEALERIITLSRGLPHYAHLLGLHASRAALDGHSLTVSLSAVDVGIEKAFEDVQQSIRTDYLAAVQSVKKVALFGDVLLACALADADERGYFTAADVRNPLRRITGKKYNIPNYAQHLSEFADKKRGRILIREGDSRYRYRFADPLMQPYVIMMGLKDKRTFRAVVELSPSTSEPGQPA